MILSEYSMPGENQGEQKIVGALSKEVANEKAMRKTEDKSLESFEQKQKRKDVLQAKRSVSRCSE